MSTKPASWDTELYESRHSFVWQYGEGLLDVLAAQPGERILDLGCGTGQLTDKIAAAGSDVIGLDASPDMIGQARQNFPRLQFTLQDAALHATNVTVFAQVEFKVPGTYYVEVLVDDVMKLRYPVPVIVAPPQNQPPAPPTVPPPTTQ